jgi:hypothetical protein
VAKQQEEVRKKKLTKAELETLIIQKANGAAEQLLQLAVRGPDGIVASIDAMATVHATILMRFYEDADWPGLLKMYHQNVADKIIAVGQAMVRALEEGGGDLKYHN